MRRCIGVLGGAAVALGACGGGPKLITRTPVATPVAFSARALVVVSDVDMPGTGYADGVLKPIAGAVDSLTVLTDVGPSPRRAAVAASNSVMGWPGLLALDPTGSYAYVVEVRAAAPAGLTRCDDVYRCMPKGRLLTTVDVRDPAAPRVVGTLDVGTGPLSIDVARSGRFALVTRRDPAAPLAAILLDAGVPTRVVELPITHAVAPRQPRDSGALAVRLAPDGRHFALNLANTHLATGRLTLDDRGLPIAATLVGEPIRAGRQLTMLRWAVDGRHLVAADVAWGAGRLGAVRNGPGQLLSFAIDSAGRAAPHDSIRVSLSPEGFDVSRDGTMLVTVNMERTYLPDGFPYVLFGRRDQASLTLLGFDVATGRFRHLDGPIAFAGVLPEDAVFDDDGDMIAVAVFHAREAQPVAGFVELVCIERTAGGARLVPTGTRIPTARGPHDLVVIPAR